MAEDIEKIEITLEHLVAMLTVSEGANVGSTHASTLLMEINYDYPDYVKVTWPNGRKNQKKAICWAEVTEPGKDFLLEKIKEVLGR